MRPADTWVDYELIDATNHNRLERWGKTLLIRPDPQIIWKNEEVSPLWARADAIYYRSAKGGGQWDYHKKLPQKWNIKWQDLTLIVSPTGFKHTGVFPEQAVNWAWYQEKIKAADRPVKVLNLFGYTGGATLACLAAGASVTHVDASKGMVAWARENAQASSLADRPCRWIVDDCAKFVQREIRRGSRYDAVVDNTSSARFKLGEGRKCPRELNLANVGMCLQVNGKNTGFGAGASVMGHPARAVAELVRGLWKEGGKGLKKGDIILSGAITPSTPVQVGDALRADFGGLGYVEIQIKE